MTHYLLKFSTLHNSAKVKSALMLVIPMTHEIKEDGVCHVHFDAITDDVEQLLHDVAYLKSTELCAVNESLEISAFLAQIQKIKMQLEPCKKEIKKLDRLESTELVSLKTSFWSKKRPLSPSYGNAIGNALFIPVFIIFSFIFLPLFIFSSGWTKILFLCLWILIIMGCAAAVIFISRNYYKKNKIHQNSKSQTRANLSDIEIRKQACKDRMLTICAEYYRELSAVISNYNQKPNDRILPTLLFILNSFIPDVLLELLYKMDVINLQTFNAMLQLDEDRFHEIISDTCVKYGFSIDGDHLVINDGAKGDFAKDLPRMLELNVMEPPILASFRSTYKNSKQIPIGAIKQLLHLDEAEFDAKIIDLAIEFGLVIDGNNLDARNANLDGFFTKLENEIKGSAVNNE